MADEKKLPREPDQGFVPRLVPDPATPPDLRLLAGYPGASSQEGHARLYASPDLSAWWDIPEDAVLHRRAVPGDPLGAEILWIRRDQQPVLNQGRIDPNMTPYTFPTLTYFTCPTGPQQPPQHTQAGFAYPPTWFGFGCGPGPVQPPHTQAAQAAPTAMQICTILPPQQQPQAGHPFTHPPFCMITVVMPPTQDPNCGTSPVGAAQNYGWGPTAFCTGHTTTPVGAQQQAWVRPPVTHDVQCMTGTTPAGVQPQQTWVRPPVTFDCGTTPVGAAQAQPLPSITWPTIPPATICCR